MPVGPHFEEAAEVVLRPGVGMHAQADALRVADLGGGGPVRVVAEIPLLGPPDHELLAGGCRHHRGLTGLQCLPQARFLGGVEALGRPQCPVLGGLGEHTGLGWRTGLSLSVADQGLALGQQLAMEPLLEVSFSQNLVLFLQYQKARDSSGGLLPVCFCGRGPCGCSPGNLRFLTE